MGAAARRTKADVQARGRPTCAECPTRHRGEWCVLQGDDVARLNRAKVCTAYAAGQVIFHQASPCLGLHCVVSGTIALRKVDARGKNVIVRLAHAGETLGLRTFLAGGSYSVSAEALTRARVCFVERAAVMDLVGRSAALGLSFARRLAEDLRAAEEEKLDAATGSVRERVARLLLLLSDRYGEETPRGDGLSLQLPTSRQDIAALLGVRAESVTRAVRALEDARVARFDGRRVTIPSVERLMAELSGGY